MAQRLIVEIVGDTSSLERAFGRASGQASTFGTRMRGFGKAAAFAAGSAGVAGLTYALTAGVNELRQHALVAAQTAQVLKTTGGAANVTAKDVNNLANSIMKKTGIDDEAVQSTENLLLGFTRIRNEVGKNNDIFNQATMLVQDYAVRTGRSATSAAIIFGKALNDPIKGLTALTRVGVTFTDAQKAQIKAMVAAGDTMGAQKVILAELERRYGGAAVAAGQTLPGQLDILKQRFNNLAGQGVQVLANELRSLEPIFQTVGQVIGALVPIIAPLAKYLFDNIVVPFKVIADLLRGDWGKAWDDAKKPVQDMVAVVTGLWGQLQGVVTTGMTAIQNALTTGWTTVRNLAVTAWTEITTAIRTALNTVLGLVRTVMGAVGTAISTVWTTVRNGTVTAWATIRTAVVTGANAVRSAITSVFTTLPGLARNAFSGMVGAIRGAVGAAASAAGSFGRAILNGIVNALKSLGSQLIKLIVAPVNKIIGAINAIQIHVPGLHFDTHIPGVGTVGFDGFDVDPIPGDIPKLEAGGLVTKTGLAIVHRGETFSGVGRGLGGAPVTLNVTVNAETSDPAGLAKAIVRPMVRELQVYARGNSLSGLLGT